VEPQNKLLDKFNKNWQVFC